MKLAVTDACIFIELIDLKITSNFFSLNLEVHTTNNVSNELDEDQKELLFAYRTVEKLYVHILEDEDEKEMIALKFPKRLSKQDQTVIYLAQKLDALILSSDKPVRNSAKSLSIDHHGMFWIFDQLVEIDSLSKSMASNKLRDLLTRNLMYRDNLALWKEADKRFKLWEK